MFFKLWEALFNSAAQKVFTSELVKSLIKNVPSVNLGLVLAAGVTDIKRTFGMD
ncbi:hypothetical protein K504DRAFT_461867 [Pleomassaria siparia CBS 279.74]|uniref:Uncharacterized protein n=1 Tax=Pleomassaria siparia CBS 279.74 TaxID=1314801 RepID=A0A6G1KKH3_9PLEO|nr:hypothetical protein K504DRAFT_461867 [Pleomassaria siparia CBS 279.74]